jgi:hypothetical protein
MAMRTLRKLQSRFQTFRRAIEMARRDGVDWLRVGGWLARDLCRWSAWQIVPARLTPSIKWPAFVVGPLYGLTLYVAGFPFTPAYALALAAVWLAGLWSLGAAMRWLGAADREVRAHFMTLVRRSGEDHDSAGVFDATAIKLEAAVWRTAQGGNRQKFAAATEAFAEHAWKISQLPSGSKLN